MIGCKYVGTFQDPSGYGQANRNFIAALVSAGIDVSTELVAQTPEKTRYGWVDKLTENLMDRDIDYKVKIIHLTPDLYPKHLEDGKYNIGHLFWETNRLPKPWIAACNMMNEIWCASTQQADMIKESGVTVPIYYFPQPIDTSRIGKITVPYSLPNFNGYLFYGIFQWIERKNPKALLMNYWKTFQNKDDVALLLKTYRITYSDEEFIKIREEIAAWKRELNLPHYPKVFLCSKLLDTDSLFRLHLTGDCFINASRGEGWNIPSSEAMLMGNPMISIDKTGITDYLSRDLYYPCKTQEASVTAQPFIPWYEPSQKWLEIDAEDLSSNMLDVYNNKERAKQLGKKAQEYIRENFNYFEIGMKMKERLQQIYEK